MACILKAPSGPHPGVVVFTTPERDGLIKVSPEGESAIRGLKPRWVVGLHHNWHDPSFAYDPLFDFSMAGEGDLGEADSDSAPPLISLDACNFVPEYFAIPNGAKFWDLLVVARPVGFKGYGDFFDMVRSLYDDGRRIRVLAICPMPPFDPQERGTVLFDIEETYEDTFDAEERKLFSLLVIRRDYPFPLDLATLAHFYRSSRVFAHFAPDERRVRAAAYAWTAGLPVIGTAPVASLLPTSLRSPPYFFEANDTAEFAESALSALATAIPSPNQAQRHFVETKTAIDLVRQLRERFPSLDEGADDWATSGLGIRLGRHHELGFGPNNVGMGVLELVDLLSNNELAVRDAVSESSDPEIWLSERSDAEPWVRPTSPQQPLLTRLFGRK